MQEDPIWFAAGDLNVHRYVWNNPLNWTDPSGLTAEYIIAGGIAGSLAQGNIASETDFSSGANTAAFLRGSDLNPLSATAGNINCAFYILGAAIAEGGNGETSVDAEKCGVDVKPVEVAFSGELIEEFIYGIDKICTYKTPLGNFASTIGRTSQCPETCAAPNPWPM